MKDITVIVLRKLATFGTMTKDQMYDLADEIEKADLNDRPCCPMCEEVCCDEDCPLASVRDPIVASWNKSKGE